ncbi:serine/threonine-protein kinase [Actinocorallia longicatena]|uniref:Protein kinase domain-containing protein n=1 Tax=Actinocorallia longicatena TaxID=111803 RepID=A0ABP6Q113_9ACTN
MTDGPGTVIGGRYRLETLIGEGGMGQVWSAEDEMLRREVAVKVLRIPESLGERQRELLRKRALREARSAARLGHPGIVTVHDIIERADGGPAIVMELIDGESLEDLIRRNGKLPVERVAALGTAILAALTEAHRAGVVHRDLKPANVLLSGRRVVITDFGIASLPGDPALTGTGDLIGTPSYMPPEQARGEEVSPAGDLWSLGATLYHAVEGRPPFTGDGALAVLSALINEPLPAPGHAGPLTPLLTELLRKDPGARVNAAGAAVLLGDVAGPPFPVERPPAAEPAVELSGPGRRDERSRRDVLLAAGGAFAVALCGLTIWVLKDDDEQGTAAPKPLPPSPAVTTSTPRRVIKGFGDAVTGLSISPDGAALAISSSDRTVQLWSMTADTPPMILKGHTARVRAVDHSPDGRYLASAGDDRTIRIWDARTGKRLETLTGHTGPVGSLHFSHDGSLLGSGGADQRVILWSTSSWDRVVTLGDDRAPAKSLRFSPDDRILATANDSEIRLWNVATRTPGSPMRGHGSWIGGVLFTPDGRTLISAGGDRDIRFWDVASGASTSVVKSGIGPIYATAISADGRLLATGSDDGQVVVWDLATRAPVRVVKPGSSVWTAAFTADAATLITGVNEKETAFWDLR